MKLTGIALVLAVVPSLALSSCRPAEEETGEQMEMATATEMEALSTAITSVRNAFVEAYQAGDAAALAALFTEDGMRLGPNEPMVKGRAAIEESLSQLFAGAASAALTVEPVDEGGGGNFGYEIGTYKVKVEMKGEAPPIEDQGKYVVLVKQTADGSWKLYTQIWNSDLPTE